MASASATAAPPRATIVVCYQNHFDLVWRRGWRRAYEHEGLVYRPYADVEEAWMDACLALAEREGAAFQIEQALTLREYLRRRPEALTSLRRLAAQGRFAVCGAGEAIIDVNLCLGETMVRNLASGLRWVRATLGYTPPIACHNDGFGSSAQFPQAVRGCGLRGIDNLSYVRPDAPYWRGLDGATVLAAIDRPGVAAFSDHCYYEPCLACRGTRVDAGGACAPCRGTGLRLSQGVYPRPAWVPAPAPPLGRYHANSEEMLPDAALPRALVQRNAADPDVRYVWGVDDRLRPLWDAALARVDAADIPVSSRVENNPAQTGCYVSRLRVKQAARSAEGAFYAAERLAAVATLAGGPRLARELEPAWLALPLLHFHDAVTGTHCDPAAAELLDAARDAELTARAVADAAFAHLVPGARPLRVIGAGDTVAVFNPTGEIADLDIELPARGGAVAVLDAAGVAQPVHRQPDDADPPAQDRAEELHRCRAYRAPASPEAAAPNHECVGPGYHAKRGEAPPTTLRFRAGAVPPLGVAVFRLRAAASPPATAPTGEAALDGTVLRWDARGVTGIAIGGDELIDAARGPAGHLLVERDEGDPWNTRATARDRVSCAGMQRLLRARRTADLLELCYAGAYENGPFGDERDPRVFGLHWRQTVRVRRGLPGVEFEYDLFWQTMDRRLRLCFPSRGGGDDRGLYGIPAGSLVRERYEMSGTCVWSGSGDWPAVGFAATLPGANGPGLALIERGTPSFRIEDGVLMCSVLRSAGFGHCLTRFAQEYPMPLSGMRDGGRHVVRLLLAPHRGDDHAVLVALAARTQLAPPVALAAPAAANLDTGWAIADAGVELAALKEAWDGDGVVLRLIERLGHGRTVLVRVPPAVHRVRGADHLEDPDGSELPVRDGAVAVPLRAWGIRTLRCDASLAT